MAGFGRSNSLSINTGGGLLYVSLFIVKSLQAVTLLSQHGLCMCPRWILQAQ